MDSVQKTLISSLADKIKETVDMNKSIACIPALNKSIANIEKEMLEMRKTLELNPENKTVLEDISKLAQALDNFNKKLNGEKNNIKTLSKKINQSWTGFHTAYENIVKSFNDGQKAEYKKNNNNNNFDDQIVSIIKWMKDGLEGKIDLYQRINEHIHDHLSQDDTISKCLKEFFEIIAKKLK